MKKILNESSIIFFSITKWIFLAGIVGIIVGFSTFFFLKLLKYSIDFTAKYPHFYVILPLGMVTSTLLIKYFAPGAKGHGTEKVIEAVHKKSGKIDIAVVPVKTIATIITIATGGSAGKEGPAAQIGAGLASFFAELIRLDKEDRKKLVICGLSAGFSSVFGTPIAGSIFGVEILFSGKLRYDVLLPSLVAGMVSFQITSAFGITYFYRPLHLVPELSHLIFFKVILFGLMMGIIALLFIETIELGESLGRKMDNRPVLKALFGGVLLVILIFLIPGGPFYGLGVETLESILEGTKIIWYAFIVKTIFTSITLGFGGSGGILLPIFFVGASAGSFLGSSIGEDPGTFAAIGMAGLLSGTTNAPIASIIFAMEFCGTPIAPYACLTSIICYLISGHRSVFPSQILAMKKSSSVNVEIGKEMENLHFIGGRSKTVKRFKRFISHFFLGTDLAKKRKAIGGIPDNIKTEEGQNEDDDP